MFTIFDIRLQYSVYIRHFEQVSVRLLEFVREDRSELLLRTITDDERCRLVCGL